MKSFVIAALLPVLAMAQSALPTGATSLPACALTCSISTLGTGGCTSATDITCICTSAEYQASNYQCLVNSCNATDLQSALAYGSTLCESNGTPINTAVTPSGITSAASSTDATSAAASSATDAISSVSSEIADGASSVLDGASSLVNSLTSQLSPSNLPQSSDATALVFSGIGALGAAVFGALLV